MTARDPLRTYPKEAQSKQGKKPVLPQVRQSISEEEVDEEEEEEDEDCDDTCCFSPLRRAMVARVVAGMWLMFAWRKVRWSYCEARFSKRGSIAAHFLHPMR